MLFFVFVTWAFLIVVVFGIANLLERREERKVKRMRELMRRGKWWLE